jgi:hypothetical protein
MENLEYKKLAINDLLDLIERADNRVKEWQKTPNNSLIIEQWLEKKKRYASELLELLKDYNLPLQLNEV